MLNFIDTTIQVPHLNKSLTLFHMTDLHITRADERDNDYVNWLGIDRKRCFPDSEVIFEEIKQHIRDNPPDYTVLTGDIIDFPSERNLDTLTEFLNNDCGNYLYTLGNHDWCYPNESPSEETRNKYYPRLFAVTNGTPDFQVIDAGGVLLIGIDNTRNQITEAQLNKLKKEFNKNIPCILFFHVPVYIDTLIENVVHVWRQPLMIGTPRNAFSGELDPSLIPTEETIEFCNLIAKSDSPVVAVLCGHVHFFHEDSFGKGKIQYVTELCCNKGTIRRIHIVSQE